MNVFTLCCNRNLLIYVSVLWLWVGFAASPVFANSTPPYNASKFHSVLNISKLQYPDSRTKFAKGKLEGKSIENKWYLRDGQVMTFLSEGDLRRTELRLEYQFKINKGTNRIYGRVRPKKPKSSKMDQFTFLQLHHFKGEGPACRMIWHRSRRGETDSIWAVVRTKPGQSPKYYYLGKRSSNFQNTELKTSGNRLYGRYGSRTFSVKLSGYTNKEMYWKAGAYNQDPGTSMVEYSKLKYQR